MNLFTRFKFFLWYFGKRYVPLIGYLKPKLILLTENEIVVKIKLNRRSKNHLNSMYFGALSVGADLASGFHGLYHAKLTQTKVSLAFKSFQAEFIKRPETDVYFVCNSGHLIKDMLQTSKQTGQRINKLIEIIAYINYPQKPEKVANFILELSLKALSTRVSH